MKTIRILLVYLMISLTLIGCAGKKEEVKKIKIAEQYGLAYAPLQIMKEKGFLEELIPNTEVEWVKLSNTAAIREAMLTDNLDAGFMGIPPFLIGLDNGMNWKMMTGLSKSPLGLVTYDESIQSLADFTSSDKIALPQPGSIQHILLAMACEKQLGEADKLDQLLVSMKHPDGYQALTSKSITAHFTSPPYLFEELNNKENHLVVTGEEAVGQPFTFIVGVSTEEFYNNKKEQYSALNKALSKAIDFMNTNEEETIIILSKAYDLEPDVLKEYLNYEGMDFSTDIAGVEEFIDFMVRNDYLKKAYALEDVKWE